MVRRGVIIYIYSLQGQDTRKYCDPCDPRRMSDEEATSLQSHRNRKRKRKRKQGEGNGGEGKCEGSEEDNRALEHPSSGPAAVFNNTRTIYIEGLPFAAKEHDVINFFKPAGRVLSVRLPTWQDSGRLRGYGHVEFATAEMATKALELDGSDMQNRYIKIARPMTPRLFQVIEDRAKIEKPVGCRSIFIKNIPYDVTEDDVKEAVKICGPIENVRLAVWGHTQKLKGFGYVDFVREESAEIAVKKSGTLQVKGRPIIVDFEVGQAKGSWKAQKGIGESRKPTC